MDLFFKKLSLVGQWSGNVPNITKIANISLFSSIENITNIEEQVAKFWRIKECTTNETYSLDEKICKKYFENTVVQNSDGRFTVKLPLRDTCVNLGDSYSKALQRFYSLEKRFKSNPKLKCEYSKFMKEYYDLNHMEKCEYNEKNESKHYFLTHHVVFKNDSVQKRAQFLMDRLTPHLV